MLPDHSRNRPDVTNLVGTLATGLFSRAESTYSRARRLVALLVLALVCWSCQGRSSPAAPVRVAAAADLAAAFEVLGREFEAQTGRAVVFSFGSTGLLARQLREGAPFDVFAAANVSFVDEVVAAGACDGATKQPYARGRIAAWVRDGAAPASPASLVEPRFVRIAIANPEHAPYGMAAREALQRVGAWETIETRLVYGENVRQTLQLAESGNADAAIVALSLVIKHDLGAWTLIDESLHAPIDQALVACRHGSDIEGGKAFARFLDSDRGRAIMREYGFLLPGESAGSTR